jgi:hypothetical protein
VITRSCPHSKASSRRAKSSARRTKARLTGAAADRAVDAVVALVDVMSSESAALEAFILSQGFRKSNKAAPKSTGF